MESSPGAYRRLHIVDAIRGFALGGIVIVHMVEQYLGAPPTEEMQAVMTGGPSDGVIQAFLEVFFRGKFFALFSFLFGLSFFIQMDRAAQRGIEFRGRFIWRLALLFAIGFVHSLFYRGDILMIYAVLGVCLVPFYRVNTAVILTIAGLIFLGTARYLVFAMAGGTAIIDGAEFDPALAQNQAYYDALLSGSIGDVFAANVWQGQLVRLEFQINVFGRWYLTFAYFLLGLWVGRMRLFENLDAFHGAIRKTLWVSVAGCAVFLVTTIALFAVPEQERVEPALDTWREMIALTSYDLFNVALSALILSSFILIYRRARAERLLEKLAPYGRTALSNYVLQTVIGTFILYNWGLGLLGQLSNTQMFALALFVIALQIYASAAWLRHFQYGPLEWAWRSGTKGELQPMRRAPAAR